MSRADSASRGPTAALVVLALHLMLAAVLWHTLRHREMTVSREHAPLVWVQPLAATPPPPPTLPPQRPQPATAASPKTQPAALPIATPPHESTWVRPAPPVAAVPAPSAASDVPPLRLLDTEGTRAAIRQTGRQALLQERAAQATDTAIARTDTALAGGVAHAGLPDCMKDPNAAVGHIGPIALGGILGLPFLAARVATGRCAK